jgi:hypothetical protein
VKGSQGRKGIQGARENGILKRIELKHDPRNLRHKKTEKAKVPLARRTGHAPAEGEIPDPSPGILPLFLHAFSGRTELKMKQQLMDDLV